VLGDGSLTATSAATSLEAQRVHGLLGRRLELDRLPAASGRDVDLVGAGPWTVLYCFPGAEAPGGRGYPPGWADIPGAPGCTLESTTFRDRHADFVASGVTVRGVSTQRPDQLAAFAEHAGLPFELLSDADLDLAGSLRLPTFRAAGVDRFKRLTLVVDAERTVREVLFPISDPAASVDDVLQLVRALDAESASPGRAAAPARR
jgi:peroxiredoxin